METMLPLFDNAPSRSIRVCHIVQFSSEHIGKSKLERKKCHYIQKLVKLAILQSSPSSYTTFMPVYDISLKTKSW